MTHLSATVDRLLDPPGCEWNRAQTHRSLVTYLVEETFELVEAIEDGTPADLREELGDVLYQVVLHAAIASRDAREGFGLADVVREVDEKITRRHPHVFGVSEAAGVDDIVRLWTAAKADEKSGRASAFDGIPMGLPALARAQKVAGRAGHAGLDKAAAAAGAAGAAGAAVDSGVAGHAGAAADGDVTGEALGSGSADADELAWGRRMLAHVDLATARGFDAERALRAAVRERESALRAAETPAITRQPVPETDE